MKLKFINYLLAAGMIFTAAQGLTSCKDTDEDMYAAAKADHAALQKAIDDLRAETAQKFTECQQKCADALAAHKAQNDAEFARLQGEIDKLSGELSTLSYKLGELEQKYKDLEPRVEANENAIKEANEKIAANEKAISTMQELIKTIEKDLSELTEVVTLQGKTIAEMKEDLQKLSDELTELKKDVAANTEKIKELDKKVADLLNIVADLQNRISSIELQACYNPITGYLNTPFDMSVNVLLGYCGHNQYSHVKFPSTSAANTYNGKAPVITDKDIEMLTSCGLTVETIGDGAVTIWNDASEVSVGKVYLTLNPANINLDGKEYALVNSQGKELPINLDVQPSDYLLTFGYSRSQANGFYEANATVPAAKAGEVRWTGDPNFKNDVLDILKDVKGNANVGTVAALAKATYKQFNGFLPALGVQAKWQESTGTQVVTSKYGVGAAVYQPLSFRFVNGVSGIPTIPAIPGSINFKFDMGAPSVEFTDNFTIGAPGDEFYMSAPITVVVTVYPEKLQAKINGIPKLNDMGQQIGVMPTQTVEVTTISKLAGEVKKIMMDVVVNQAPADRQAKLTASVNSFIASLDAKIDDNSGAIQVAQSVAEVLTDAQNEINDKINKVNDILSGKIGTTLNNVINRVNKAISDPNHFLQPVLLCSNGGKLSLVSNTPVVPTVISGNGAVTLVPTTYTAELVAPAYKKLVGVTNVYKTNDHRNAAQAGYAPAIEVLKKANKNGLGEVIAGNRHRVPFVIDESYKGYTFEILYAAIDFQGCASSQKFYVTVK